MPEDDIRCLINCSGIWTMIDNESGYKVKIFILSVDLIADKGTAKQDGVVFPDASDLFHFAEIRMQRTAGR